MVQQEFGIGCIGARITECFIKVVITLGVLIVRRDIY
jgi:hypothetical protein